MVNGITLSEEGHFVTLFDSDDQGAAGSSEVLSMKNWAHCTILISKGAGSASTIVVKNATSFAGAGAATMPFAYYKENATDGDTLSARANATTAGTALSSSAGTILAIEIDADELPDGSPYLYITHNTTTASEFSAMAILTGGRFQKSESDTAIA